jgi:Sap, sulfolipid-1-addressing protein
VLDLLPLAVASAVYPTLLAAVVLILTRPNPRRLLAAYLAGGFLVSMTAGLLVVRALTAGHSVGGGDHTVGPGIDLIVGLLALGAFVLLLTGRDEVIRERRRRKHQPKPTVDKEPWSDRILGRNSLMLTFVLGIGLNLPGAFYLVALKDIAAADQGTAQDVTQILVFNLIMFMWAEIPVIGYTVAPEKTQAFITGAQRWLGRHSRQIAMAICAAAAAVLLFRGLVDLL